MIVSFEALGEHLAERLATVQPNVHRGRRQITTDMMPCAVLIEGESGPRERRGKTTEYRIDCDGAWHLYVPCDPNDPNLAAHEALRQAKRALWSDGARLGGRVEDCEFRGTDIMPRADGAGFVLAVLTYRVQLVEDVADPK